MAANVKLSANELALLTNGSIFLTKQVIVEKIYELLGNVCNTFEKRLTECTNLSFAKAVSPKISKGENYVGQPWVALDYPRIYRNTDVFAVRVWFWWGNFCSISLHIGGKYVAQYGNKLQNTSTEIQWQNWLFCTSDTPWEHHLSNDIALPALSKIPTTPWSELPFIKLSKKIPLQKWDDIETFLVSEFECIVSTLNYAPNL